MSEGGMLSEVPTPERGASNPTEASKGFLGKMAHGAKETGIAIAAGLTPGGAVFLAARREMLAREVQMAQTELAVKPETQPKPEVIESTPTKASKNFLERTGQRIKRNWLGYLSWGGLIAAVGGGSGVFETSIVGDVAQGNFKSLAARGAIVALTSLPEGIIYLKQRKAYRAQMAQEKITTKENGI